MEVTRKNRIEDSIKRVIDATTELNGTELAEVLGYLIASRVYEAVSFANDVLCAESDGQYLIDKSIEYIGVETKAQYMAIRKEDENG